MSTKSATADKTTDAPTTNSVGYWDDDGTYVVQSHASASEWVATEMPVEVRL